MKLRIILFLLDIDVLLKFQALNVIKILRNNLKLLKWDHEIKNELKQLYSRADGMIYFLALQINLKSWRSAYFSG
jgi:hypothetical protein